MKKNFNVNIMYFLVYICVHVSTHTHIHTYTIRMKNSVESKRFNSSMFQEGKEWQQAAILIHILQKDRIDRSISIVS